MPPALANGKICYFEIPALNIAQSAKFYEAVFGWRSRKRGDGSLAFDDSVGELSGTRVLGRTPMRSVGLLVYIMVNDAEDSMIRVLMSARQLVTPATRAMHTRETEGQDAALQIATELALDKTRQAAAVLARAGHECL